MTTMLAENTPTALDLRARLHEMVCKDLLGPAGGPEEEIDERNVRSRYIVGLLAPRGQTWIPDETDDLSVGGAEDGQDGKSDTVVPQFASMLPSSIGFTFAVARDVDAISVTVHWGRYKRDTSDTLMDDAGNPRLVWKREPVNAVTSLALRAGKLGPWYPEAENEDVYVGGICRQHDNAWTVTLFLVNAQAEPKTNKDEAWLFQPQLIVRDIDSRPIFIKRQLPKNLARQNPEDRTMEMAYRRTVEFAVGHGVGVHAKVVAPRWDRAVQIETTMLPTHEVERMDPPSVDDIPTLQHAVLDMQILAATERGNFAAALAPLADAYATWLDEQAGRLDQPTPDLAAYAIEAGVALDQGRAALARIHAGIELLDSDERAANAFRFANRAMQLQRVRSIFAAQVRRGAKPDMATINVPSNRSWYPFQLAFLLLNLPALNDPTHDERSELADLLWFPTGGGKTEAYLGVAAFAMGVRRLQGELGGLSGHAGVTVLMRYTLRLLTLQQFQRATTLIAACEMIRRDDPSTWGPEPFRIGLWVGQRSTPNWTKDSAEAVKQTKQTKNWQGGVGGSGTPVQLTNCPWCGKPIDAGKNIVVELPEQGRGRTFQYCSDKYGRCPFSYKQSPDEGLPIVVVDEEIYRRLPTLLIATVDKFAQMPWKGETQMLFGRVNGYCPRHGYRSPDIEDAGSHPRKGRFPAVKTQEVGPLRPPDLIIQDELHLISGPLGTLVGLYETAVDKLCSWELEGKTIRPKVIASTATIRRATDQVHNLFLRQLRIFPPPGLDADDNFFSRRRASSNASPGRLYVGVCAPGVRLKTVLIRVYVATMAAAQVLYEEYGDRADPWMTLVGYFNSMRELGGMRRVADDAVRTRLGKMADRGMTSRYISPYDVEELTSRKSAGDIPQILDRLETSFSAETVGPEGKGKSKVTRGTGFRSPYDIVLATNMISVGVDVSRLGLMVTAGQPKATAEYIQATSRVGRRFPGLVVTVYNWARPRDLSHYERFEHYHATFYQQVEALSVTPFAKRALDRGLTGTLVSLIRLLGDELNANAQAGQLTADHAYIEDALTAIGQRAAQVEYSNSVGDEVQRELKSRIDQWLNQVNAQVSGSILGYRGKRDGRTLPLLHQPLERGWDAFTCLNSLRDVEPNVALILDDYGMDREPERVDDNDNRTNS